MNRSERWKMKLFEVGHDQFYSSTCSDCSVQSESPSLKSRLFKMSLITRSKISLECPSKHLNYLFKVFPEKVYQL